MEWLSGYIVGCTSFCIGVIVSFTILDLTQGVHPQQVEQAVSKCKDGEWEKISNTIIICADGTEYKLIKGA